MRTHALSSNHGFIQRGATASLVQAAAYQHAAEFVDERTGMKAVYLRDSERVVATGLMAPEGAAEWLTRDAERFWNYVEKSEDDIHFARWKDVDVAQAHIDKAAVGMRAHFSVANELGPEAAEQLAKEFVRERFNALGLIAGYAVHNDEGNLHFHILSTRRVLKGDAWFGRQLFRLPADLSEWERGNRAWLANRQNEMLAERLISVRVEHRSFAEQGISIEPKQTIGPAAQAIEAREQGAARVADADATDARNVEKLATHPRFGAEYLARDFTATDATQTERQLREKLLTMVQGDAELCDRLLPEVLADPRFVRLGADENGAIRYTTASYLETEQALFTELRAHALAPLPGVDPAARDALLGQNFAWLTDGQKLAVEHMTDAGGVRIVVGRAGVGKTTLLQASRQLWEQSGLNVRGAAIAWDAAQTLATETGIRSQAVADFLQAYKQRDEIQAAVAAGDVSERQAAASLERLKPQLLTARDVLVIDEAGQLGTEDLGRLVKAARESGARLILTGDDTQFQAIAAGRAFAGAIEEIGAARVTEIRRQRADAEDVLVHRDGLDRDVARDRAAGLTPAERSELVRDHGRMAEDAGVVWRRDAAMQLADWNVRGALEEWDRRGFVHFEADRSRTFSAVINNFFDHLDRGVGVVDQPIYAFTNADVKALNAQVQAGLQNRGQVGETAFAIQDRSFGIGDRVVFSDGDKHGQHVTVSAGDPVYRNTRGTLTGYKDGIATVKLDDGRQATFRPNEFRGLDLGYARTLYKGQGHTVGGDESGIAHVLVSQHMRADSAYVAGTRSKYDTHWYAARSEFAGMPELAATLGRSPRKDLARDYMLPEQQTLTKVVRDFLAARRDYASLLSEIERETHRGVKLSTHERWAELQELKQQRDFGARMIAPHRDKYEGITRRAGLSWETIEVAAGRRTRPLTTAELAARTEALRYGLHARDTRDMWNTIKTDSARGRYKNHPLYAEFERMRAVRDALAQDLNSNWNRFRRWAPEAGISAKAVEAQAAAARNHLYDFDLGPYIDRAQKRAEEFLTNDRLAQSAAAATVPASTHYAGMRPLGPSAEDVAAARTRPLTADQANMDAPMPADGRSYFARLLSTGDAGGATTSYHWVEGKSAWPTPEAAIAAFNAAETSPAHIAFGTDKELRDALVQTPAGWALPVGDGVMCGVEVPAGLSVREALSDLQSMPGDEPARVELWVGRPAERAELVAGPIHDGEVFVPAERLYIADLPRTEAQGLPPAAEILASLPEPAMPVANGSDLYGPPSPQQHEAILQAVETTFARFTDHEATATEATIRQRVADIAGADQFVSLSAQTAVMNDTRLVSLGRDTNNEVRFTTARYQGEEVSFLSAAQRLAATASHPVDPIARATILDKNYAWLSAGQRLAVEHMTEASGAAAVVGLAGTGKTTMMKAAREVWEGAGYRVRGAALAWSAARQLEAESGIKSESIARILWAEKVLEQAASPAPNADTKASLIEWAKTVALKKGDVLVLDEAGQIGTEEFALLHRRAAAVGAKVVSIGDDQQFQAIGAGRAFTGLTEEIGAARVTDIRRQRADIEDVIAHRDGIDREAARRVAATLSPEEQASLVRQHGPAVERATEHTGESAVWRRQAAARFASYDTRAALQMHADRGHIQFVPSERDAMARLTSRYFELHDQGVAHRNQAVYAFTNAQVDALNLRIRDGLVQRGIVGPAQIEMNGYGFGIGDRIRFTEADRRNEAVTVSRGETPLLRGTTGTLAAIEQTDKGLRVSVVLDDGRKAVFDPTQWTDVRHAYAGTLYQGQGQTIGGEETGIAHVLASPHMRADSTYVAFTRSKYDTALYVARNEFPGMAELADCLGRSPTKDLARDYSGPQAQQRNAVVAAFRHDRAELGRLMVRINQEIGPDDKPWNHPDWDTAKVLKRSRDQLAQTMAQDRDAYVPVLRRSGLSWEAVENVINPENRTLKTPDQVARATTRLYHDEHTKAQDLWQKIVSSHGTSRAQAHPLYKAYQSATDVRDRAAADMVQNWPQHRRWAQKRNIRFADVQTHATAYAERAGMTYDQLVTQRPAPSTETAATPQQPSPVTVRPIAPTEARPMSIQPTPGDKTPSDLAASLDRALRASTRPGRFGAVTLDPHAERILQDGDRRVAELAAQLHRAGVRDVAPLTGGNSSVILDAGDRVIRLGAGRPPERPPIANMLQAEAAGTAGPVRWEVLPKIDTDRTKITDADVARLSDTLRAAGYRFSDPSRANIGQMPDGQHVVLKPAALRPLSPAEQQTSAAQETTRTWLIPPHTDATRDSLGRSLEASAVREAALTDAKVKERTSAFVTALTSAYRNPEAAAQAIETMAAQQGVRVAQLAMDRSPERFGELRTVAAPVFSWGRSADNEKALQSVLAASTALGERHNAMLQAEAAYRATVTAQLSRDRIGIPALSPDAQRVAAKASRIEGQPERIARLFARQSPGTQAELNAFLSAMQQRFGDRLPQVYAQAAAQRASLSPKAYLAFARSVRTNRTTVRQGAPGVAHQAMPAAPVLTRGQQQTAGGGNQTRAGVGGRSSTGNPPSGPRNRHPATRTAAMRAGNLARKIKNRAKSAGQGSVSIDASSIAIVGLRVLENTVAAKFKPVIALVRLGLTVGARMGGGASV